MQKFKLFTSVACISLMSMASSGYAAETADSNSYKQICSYDAAPQGFQYSIGKRVYPPNDYKLFIYNTKPKYYSKSSVTSMTGLCAQSSNGYRQQDNSSCLIGTQNTGSPYGGLDGTNSFVRDVNGVPINGNVYLNIGGGIAPVYTGAVKDVAIQSSATSSTCSSFSYIANKGGVPVVNAASQAWNNRGPIQSYSGPSYGNTAPDMNLSQMIDSELLSTMLQGMVNDDWGPYALLKFPGLNATLATHSRAEIKQLAARFESMGMGNYFATVYKSHARGKFIYRPLDPGPSPTLQIIDEGPDPELILIPRSKKYLAEYHKMFQQTGGNGGITVKSIYPSNLYAPPKHPAWYAGKLATNGYYGPHVTYYKHDPLPSTCNPDSLDYIPAAFLNTEVLEELRHDWRFLTKKNLTDLKNKYKIEFFDMSYASYIRGASDGTPQFLDIERCTLGFSGADDDCDGTIVSLREEEGKSTNHILRPLLPLQTMPVDGNPNHNAINVGENSKKKVALSKLKSKFKPKRKTNAYYADLINNELITINSAWNTKACIPKHIASVNNISISKPKPTMSIKKPMQKRVFEK